MGVRIRQSGIDQLVATDITRFVFRTCQRLALRARVYAPKWTHKLQLSIQVMPLRVSRRHVRGKVATGSGYGLYPEVGTGLFGPKRAPIVPRRAAMLVFRSRTTGQLIRAKSVKGQPGQHYMQRALIATIASL